MHTRGAIGPSGITDPAGIWVEKQFTFTTAPGESNIRLILVQDLDQTKGTRSSKLGTGGVYADSFGDRDKARVRAKIREHAAEMLRILDDEDSIVAQILDGLDAATQMPFFDVDESPSDSEFDRAAAEQRRNRRSPRLREIS